MELTSRLCIHLYPSECSISRLDKLYLDYEHIVCCMTRELDELVEWAAPCLIFPLVVIRGTIKPSTCDALMLIWL